MSAAGEILAGIPEFSAIHSIKIAPSTSVPVTDRLLEIIDSKVFQRLRKIRQLSLSDQVFPSATHTRFSHALGVYNNILDYLRHLDGFAEFRNKFTPDDYCSLMLAGLLHDLGHYPCSHQLDHLPGFPKHEELTIAMIKGELLVEGEDISHLIKRTFDLEPQLITRFLEPDSQLPDHLRLMKQILDSPIDADKCDYLARDSYYCGVDFGSGFDRERFIANLVPSGDHLCIHEKGLMSTERFQLARYWMYRSVYWGHTVRALITMLARASRYMEPVDEWDNWPDLLLQFNDHNFLHWLHGRVGPAGKELIEMVHFSRKPYKRLYTISFHHEPEKYHQLQQDEALQAKISDHLFNWAKSKGCELQPHHLIWDVPPVYKAGTWESFPIRLMSGREVPIAQESPVIEALSKAFLYGVRKIRLFCHPSFSAMAENEAEPVPKLASFF